jgi:hypothetical protein
LTANRSLRHRFLPFLAGLLMEYAP